MPAKSRGIVRMKPNRPRWPQDVHRRDDSSEMPGDIEATTIFYEIQDRVLGTVLLRAIRKHAQCLGAYFVGIEKSIRCQPRPDEGNLSDVAAVDQATQTRDATLRHEAHGSAFVQVSKVGWQKENHPRHQLRVARGQDERQVGAESTRHNHRRLSRSDLAEEFSPTLDIIQGAQRFGRPLGLPKSNKIGGYDFVIECELGVDL